MREGIELYAVLETEGTVATHVGVAITCIVQHASACCKLNIKRLNNRCNGFKCRIKYILYIKYTICTVYTLYVNLHMYTYNTYVMYMSCNIHT